MGCLTAKLEYQGGINATMSNNRNFTVDAKRDGGINAKFSREDTIKTETERLGKILVRFGLICSVSYVQKLAISKDSLWLIPDNMFEDSFAIFTELEWHIS